MDDPDYSDSSYSYRYTNSYFSWTAFWAGIDGRGRSTCGSSCAALGTFRRLFALRGAHLIGRHWDNADPGVYHAQAFAPMDNERSHSATVCEDRPLRDVGT